MKSALVFQSKYALSSHNFHIHNECIALADSFFDFSTTSGKGFFVLRGTGAIHYLLRNNGDSRKGACLCTQKQDFC